ncbi:MULTISPECIES: hypothetical protein [unclassified Nocardia]|uniref:hypothetical protein n=1 Tax=unclassified Nocardia TaxID=2637762 RepID=UPI001CE44B75|nr:MULTISPECIES: hypothetical protein [unclassified Nocardia]
MHEIVGALRASITAPVFVVDGSLDRLCLVCATTETLYAAEAPYFVPAGPAAHIRAARFGPRALRRPEHRRLSARRARLDRLGDRVIPAIPGGRITMRRTMYQWS